MAFEPCPNCDAEITCGCQYQTAKDGSEVCDACIENYNLAMDLAQAVVETIPTKKSKKKNEPEFPSGDDLQADDKESELL